MGLKHWILPKDPYPEHLLWSEFSEMVRIRTKCQNVVRKKSEFGWKVRIIELLINVAQNELYYPHSAQQIVRVLAPFKITTATLQYFLFGSLIL